MGKKSREKNSRRAERADEWYVADGQRGQRLLEQGQIREAADVFKGVLARLGEAKSYGRAMILGRLARCSHLSGQPDLAIVQFRDAIRVVENLDRSDGVEGLRGTLHAELGDAFRADQQPDNARKAYETALQIANELNDLRAQGVDCGQLGALALAEGQLDEALVRYQTALSFFQRISERSTEAIVWQQLGVVFQQAQRWDEAERHYRKAIEIDRQIGNPIQLARHLSNLASLLQNQPARLVEARQLVEDALTIAYSLASGGSEIWKIYGVLADITEKEGATADGPDRIALQTRASNYRTLQLRAPRILATLAGLGDAPSVGRAVMLGQLGRCFLMGGRSDLAVAQIRNAIDMTTRLETSEQIQRLRSMLQSELNEAQLDSKEEMKAPARPIMRRSVGSTAPFEMTLYEEVVMDYVFDTDLLIDGPRETRTLPWTGAPAPLADDVRPMLAPCARACLDEDEAVRLCLPPEEPSFDRQPGCTVMRRIRRDVVVSGSSVILWRLIRKMDGSSNVGAILFELASDERATAASMLAALAATGVIDISGRPIGRFLHSATKKGVLPGGGLESDEVLRLATDANYRTYPGAQQISVRQAVPDRLRGFHALTRSRRSRRDYEGLPLRREDFDALIYSACGVTGTMPWAGREVKLRAYPASGALYAVEIYPVVFRVDGLEPAVYHYRAVENVLEVVRPALDQTRFVSAMLPVEREMVAGASAMICLTAFFPRHERKYGEGGYRMLVAEAGHISQNVILAATALGLSARPFGGVFDDLVNHDLGLNTAEEQFLLAVLVGHVTTP